MMNLSLFASPPKNEKPVPMKNPFLELMYKIKKHQTKVEKKKKRLNRTEKDRPMIPSDSESE